MLYYGLIDNPIFKNKVIYKKIYITDNLKHFLDFLSPRNNAVLNRKGCLTQLFLPLLNITDPDMTTLHLLVHN